MTTAIRKTPAQAAGVCPSERAKDLSMVGARTTVTMEELVPGDIIFRPDGAFVVVRTQRPRLRILLRDFEGASLHNTLLVPGAWVQRLLVPESSTRDLGLGTIVLYPEQHLVAIRHGRGWARTAAPWSLYSDGEVLLHLAEKKTKVVRDSLRTGAQRRKRLPVGSVVACRDRETLEPTAWIRTAVNYWVGTSRGLIASDLMINYELDRRTYHVVWIPESS